MTLKIMKSFAFRIIVILVFVRSLTKFIIVVQLYFQFKNNYHCSFALVIPLIMW